MTRSRSRRKTRHKLLLRIGIGSLLLVLAAGSAFLLMRPDPAREREKHVVAAREFAVKGDTRGAAIEYKNAIQLEPNDPNLRWELGQLYLAQGDNDLAAKEIEKAQQLGLRNAETTQALLRASAQRRDYRTALRVIEGMDDATKQTSTVLAVRGDAALDSGDIEAAKKNYGDALTQDSQDVGALLGLARISLQNGDVAGASENIASVLQTQPENAEALILQGLVAYGGGDFESAIDSFRKALAADPKDLTARVNLARALIAAEHFAEAGAVVAELEELTKANPMVAFLRGQVAYHEKRYPEAKAAFTEVLLAVPNHAQSMWLLSHVLFLESDLLEAEKHATKFVDLAPDYLPGAQLLAAIHLRRNEPAKAVAVLQPLIDQGEQDPRFQLLLGSALVASGKVDEGNRHLAVARQLEPDSTVFRTQQAVGQLAAGEFDAAMRDLQAIAGEGTGSNADILLVYLNVERGNFDAALQAANALIAKQPDDASGYNLRGVVHSRQQDVTAARDDFERALRADAKFTPAIINLGYLDRLAGKLDAAKQRFNQAIEIDGTNVNSYLALAEIAAGEQDTKTAVALLEKAIANNVAAVQPRLLLARYQMAIGNVENALQLLTEAVRYAPGNAQAKFMLGEAQIAAKDMAAAKATFEALAIERPQAVEVKLQLAAIALAERQRERAKSLIDEALALDPKNPEALAVLVRLNIASGDLDRARSIAQRVKEMLPENIIGHLLVGEALLAAKDFPGAIASFQKAAEITPTTLTTQRLFDAVQQSGDTTRATTILDDWLQAHPGDLAIRNTRASIDLTRGDQAAAIARYEAILKDAPDDVIALNNLAYLSQTSERKKALVYAERAYQLAPNSVEVLDTYGWILVQQDKVSQALELLRKAAASGNPDIRYHFAAALAKAGSRAEARSELDAILAQDTAFAERRAAESLHSLLR